jgi:acetylornithine deacetylase/succinyl-diaminopimelate desuccinylase-like protein
VLEPAPVAEALRRAAQAPSEIPPEALAVLDKSVALRPLYRTTCVATQLQGGTRDNALPVEARANVNCRLQPVDTIDEVQRLLAQAAGSDAEVRLLPDLGVGPEVPVEGPVRAAVARATEKVYGPGVLLTAGLGTGASDSRFLRQRGVLAYGLGLLPVSPSDARRAHGPDERAPTGSLAMGRAFLREVVRLLAE